MTDTTNPSRVDEIVRVRKLRGTRACIVFYRDGTQERMSVDWLCDLVERAGHRQAAEFRRRLLPRSTLPKAGQR